MRVRMIEKPRERIMKIRMVDLPICGVASMQILGMRELTGDEDLAMVEAHTRSRQRRSSW
jgi:hypothetical protein